MIYSVFIGKIQRIISSIKILTILFNYKIQIQLKEHLEVRICVDFCL